MEQPLEAAMPGPLDLAALVEEHGDHLLRLCTLYLGEQSQAEDAVQDTFLRALQAWPKFRGSPRWRPGWCASPSMCARTS